MPQPNQPQPQAPDPSEGVVLGRFTGLKNTVDFHELTPQELSRAVNVDIDDSGRLVSRRGYTRKVPGVFHSLYNTIEGVVLGVKDGTLGIINPDFTFTNLRAGIGVNLAAGDLGLAYEQIKRTIYFTSRTDSGKIDLDALTCSPWGDPQDIWLSPVVNPTPTLAPIAGRLLGAPPLATTLAYFNGRLYLGQGPTLWFTELYLYDLVDRTKTFVQFEGDIVMIGVVADGFYVGTTEGVWFLTPSQAYRPEQAYGLLKRVRVMDSPVIPGSMVYIPGELANPPQVGTEPDTEMQVAISFLTTNGFCAGNDGGKCYNLTESKFFFPTMVSAAAAFRRQDGYNQYVAVTNSGGSPVSTARIGDYVDAQIIRGNVLSAEVAENATINTVQGAN